MKVVANTRDGATCSFDLCDATNKAGLQDLLRRDVVTALAIRLNGVTHALPAPKRFRRKPIYGFDLFSNGNGKPQGICVYSQADDVRVSLTATFDSKLIRTDLVRIGYMKYNSGK